MSNYSSKKNNPAINSAKRATDPKVSIIIPVYNAEGYIGQTIQSVIDQTYQNIEIIVVNDGSDDRSMEIVESFNHKDLTILHQDNLGQCAAFNRGTDFCSGSYIKFLDGDDIISDNNIQLQVNHANENPNCLIYGEWARFFNNDLKTALFHDHPYYRLQSPVDFITSADQGPMLQCGLFLVPADLIRRAGRWDERLILYNDTEFFTRLALQSSGIIHSNNAKLYYRTLGKGNLSSITSKKVFESKFLAVQLMYRQLKLQEDSSRVRNLCANLMQVDVYQMYPQYPGLMKRVEDQIRSLGGSNLTADGGVVFQLLRRFMGWKRATRLKVWMYRAGWYQITRMKNFMKIRRLKKEVSANQP